MVRALGLADDTTGALELGAVFAAAGVQGRVLLAPEVSPSGDPDAVAIDTRSRHLPASQAAGRVREALSRYGGVPAYKKTDSTLRGQIAAELDAVLAAAQSGPVVYVPAYPRLGRTVAKGVLYIDRVPVAETEFARDLRQPVRESSVPRLLESQSAYPVRLIAGAGELEPALAAGDRCILVCDARTEDDLAALAAVWGARAPLCPAAGPAAFAAHWIRLAAPSGCIPLLGSRPWAAAGLVVNGSRHSRSRLQVDLAISRARPHWTFLDARDFPFNSADRLAGELAAHAAACMETADAGVLIIFGGDTAAAVFAALGVVELTPDGELLPGVPLSRFSWRGEPRWAVTKAGGFGPPDLLVRLTEAAQSP